MKFKPWLTTLLLLFPPTLALLGAASALDPPEPPISSMKLVFDESFDSLRLAADGGSGWGTTFPNKPAATLEARTIATNNEQQVYTDPGLALKGLETRLNPFQIRDGILEIHATRVPEKVQAGLWGHPFSSGLLTSYGFAAQKYGYFEARIRVPRGKGLWPAFWLGAEDRSWPPEIDIMESVGDPSKIYASTHTRTAQGVSGETKEVAVANPGDFHTFGVLWRPETITWYVDRRAVSQQPTPSDAHKPMYVLLNLAVGGKWPGPPSPEMQEAVMEVDYVRIWSLS